MTSTFGNAAALRVVKLAHTMAWVFFAGCIVAIPVVAWRKSFDTVLALTAIVLVEIAILALNSWRCPLTPIAARYTLDRSDNFDIYIPAWVARHNRVIFGSLFVAGLLYSFARWQEWL